MKGSAHRKPSLGEAAKSKQTFCLLKYRYYECKIMCLLKYNEQARLPVSSMRVYQGLGIEDTIQRTLVHFFFFFLLGKKVGEMKDTA